MAKKNEDDPLIGHSARLHTSQVAFIKALHAKKIFPGNESDVLRHLIQRGIDELIKSEFVEKRLTAAALLDTTKS